MGKSELRQRISRLEGQIAAAERRRAEAENNIRQLEVLHACCSDYQSEFEHARTARRFRLEEFDRIDGQARLVGEYDAVLGDLLNGTEYIRACNSMDMAKSEIRREIERQRQMINECNSQIADCRSSINYCRQEIARIEREERDERNRIDNARKLYT